MRHDTTLLVSLLTLAAAPLQADARPCDRAPTLGPLPTVGGDCAPESAPGALMGHGAPSHASIWDTWTAGPRDRYDFAVVGPRRIFPRWDFTGRLQPETGLLLPPEEEYAEGAPLVAEPFSVVGRIVEEPSAAVVPEPATMTLLGSGLVGLAAARRRRKAAARDPFGA